MASVKVFGSPASTEVQRVLACLFEKQVEFQLVKMDSFRGHRRMPECLKMQPGGEALTYQDQDKDALVESRAICRHVLEKFKNQGNRELLGEGSLERALIEQWVETEAQKFDPPSSELVFYLSIAPTLPDYLNRVETPPLEESKRKLEKVLKVYDQRLADNTFLAGNKFTLADLSHLPNAQLLMQIDQTRETFSKHAHVKRWWDQISQRESWQKVLEIAKQAPPLA
ncbi:glutathione S-transferase F12-like [Phalaenopsis equestris]|uniref:glutathione S-transferase F12-like n=1 Tax=Phalaenopsis equestris TaxID=78828 RepID=UPI0009E1CF23|nr:glutathione S-transferase F12-like [Phalaenopsis equestris]